jgi:hypothetical protein
MTRCRRVGSTEVGNRPSDSDDTDSAGTFVRSGSTSPSAPRSFSASVFASFIASWNAATVFGLASVNAVIAT